MSVTINSEPLAIHPLDGFAFSATLSDAGTDPVQNSLAYEFVGPASEILVPESQIPYTGQAEFLDFTRLVASKVSTGIPSLTSRSIGTESNFVKQFFLNAGIAAFNADTCQTTVTLGTNSTTVKAINVRVRPWEDRTRFNSGDLIVLTDRPSVSHVDRKQSDWVYVFSKNGNCYYDINIRFTDGTTTTVSSFFGTTENAYSIPIGPANMVSGPFTKEISSYVVDIKPSPLVDPITSFTIYVTDDCDPDPIGEFIAREPLGGFSSLKIDNVGGGVSTTGTLFEQSKTPGSSKNATSGGLSITNVKANQVFTLSGQMEYSPGLEQWLSSLFGSDQTFVRYYNRGGSRLVKCVVTNGQYQTHSGRITSYSVTVRLHHNTND